MIESIRLKRKITEKISIGEVVDYRGNSFVITHILCIDVLKKNQLPYEAIYYCLGQQLGTPNLAEDYLPTLTELSFKPEQFNNLPEVGEIFFDNSLGIWVNIDEIVKVRFVDDEILITFKFSPIPEWTDKQIAQAMKDYRLSRMKLVRHSKYKN